MRSLTETAQFGFYVDSSHKMLNLTLHDTALSNGTLRSIARYINGCGFGCVKQARVHKGKLIIQTKIRTKSNRQQRFDITKKLKRQLQQPMHEAIRYHKQTADTSVRPKQAFNPPTTMRRPAPRRHQVATAI